MIMRNPSFWLVVSCLLTLVSCGRGPDRLGEALSSGRWEPVLREAGAAPNGAASALLRAHTLLLRNRNNEAVCEFLKADPPALREYQALTARFVKSYSASPAAYYLAGDASARSSRWPEAIALFDKALRTDPRFAPALVARGVALVSSGKVAAGKLDLYSASMMDPKLAEAQAAMGWTLLREGQPAASARNYFEAAFQLSPGYALADAGKGFAEIAAGDEDRGTGIVAAQLKSGACSSALLAANSVLAAGWMRGALGDPGGDVAPGTQIDTSLIDRAKAGDIHAFYNIIGSVGADQAKYTSVLRDVVSSLQQNRPDVLAQLINRGSSAASFTEPGGNALALLSSAKSALSLAAGGLMMHPEVPAPIKPYVLLGNTMADNLLDRQIQTTANDHQGWTVFNDMTKPMVPPSVPRPTPGGATTSLNAARVDRGHWPFKPVFGLLYPQS